MATLSQKKDRVEFYPLKPAYKKAGALAASRGWSLAGMMSQMLNEYLKTHEAEIPADWESWEPVKRGTKKEG